MRPALTSIDLSLLAQDTEWDFPLMEEMTMTDYELLDIFIQNANSLQTCFMNYVTVLFAFLIAAYLIADKLESSMVFIILGLFTLVFFQQGFNVLGFGHDVSALAGQIAVRAQEDTSVLRWHGAATSVLGSVAIPILRHSGEVVFILSYIGGLVFFFHQRRLGRAK